MTNTNIPHKALFLLPFAFIILYSTFSYPQSNTDSLIQNLKSQIVNSKDACPEPCLGDTTRINLLNKLANEYIYTAPDTALRYAEQALALAVHLPSLSGEGSGVGWEKGIANSHHTIGHAHYVMGNYEQALTHWQKALEIRKRNNDKKDIAASLGNIGLVYDNQGNYPKALSYYFHALEMDSVIGNKRGIAIRLGNIGTVYKEQGNYPKALSYYFHALEMDSVMGNKRGIAIRLGNIGIVYVEQGNYPKALSYYFSALEMDSVLGNKRGIARHLGNIGNVYNTQCNYPKALSYYFHALEMDSVLGNKSGIATWLGNIGSVYYEQAIAAKSRQDISGSDSLFKKTLSHYFKALEMDSVLGNKRGIAIKLGNIGSLYSEMKQYAQAEKYLHRSLALSDSIGTLKYTMSFEKSISELYETIAQQNLQGFGNLEDLWQRAYNHHVLYSNVRDTVFGEEKSKAVGRVEMKHEMEMEELERKRVESEKLKVESERIKRRDLLQYSLIFFVIAIILIAVLYSKRLMAKLPEKIFFIKVNKAKAGFFLIFIFIFILFETLLLFADPYITTYTGGAPAFILIINAFLACLMFPLHAVIETTLAQKTGIAKHTPNTPGMITGLVILMFLNAFTIDKNPDSSSTNHQINKSSNQPINSSTNKTADSLINQLTHIKEDTQKVNILNALFLEYEFTDAEKAKKYLTRALSLSEKLVLSVSEGTELWRTVNKGLIQTYTHLGYFADDTGNYVAALSWHQKALEIDSVSGNKSGIAKRLGNIGIVYRNQGNYPKALSYYFSALEMDSVLGNKSGIARHLGNIGIVYRNQGNYPKALSYYFQALEMDSVMRNKRGIARHLGNIGIVYYNQGNYPKVHPVERDSLLNRALSYFFHALEMDSVMGNKSGIARHLGNIGNVYKELAIAAKSRQDIAGSAPLFNKALDYYFRAFNMCEELGDKLGIAINIGNIGSLYTTMKQHAQSEKYLLQSLALSDSIGTLNYTMGIEKSISELYSQTGKWQSAYNHHVAYRTTRDSVFGEEKSKALGRVEMKHEMEMEEYRKKLEEEERKRQAAEAVGRRNELQYSAIFIGFFVLLGGIFVLSRRALPVWLIEFLTFVPFLILFEFILVLLDPQIDTITAGAPALRLLFNAVVAGLLYPLQQYSEHKLKLLFLWRKRKKVIGNR